MEYQDTVRLIIEFALVDIRAYRALVRVNRTFNGHVKAILKSDRGQMAANRIIDGASGQIDRCQALVLAYSLGLKEYVGHKPIICKFPIEGKKRLMAYQVAIIFFDRRRSNN
jgi:hypothetical protein